MVDPENPPRPGADSARPARRGRLPAADRAARESEILDAVAATLLEGGVAGTTMDAVAARAGASKETLYSWFGGRLGLLQAAIERSGDRSATRLADVLPSAGTATAEEARACLTAYAGGLLRLLTSPESTALNRAAMQQPDLAGVLLASGRHRIGPIVETYLAALHDSGVLTVPDPAAAFELLYGLVVRDTQIRVLLGEKPPPARVIEQRATEAVDQFWALMTR